MGNILNPDTDNSFTKLVKAKDSRVFVDKSNFLTKTNALINTEANLIAVTRPRRFGKTVTANMLSAYYSKGYAGQKIFNGLNITLNDDFEEHLNKYNVIYIDMNSIKDKYLAYKADKSLYVEDIDDIVDFLQFRIVTDLKKIKTTPSKSIMTFQSERNHYLLH